MTTISLYCRSDGTVDTRQLFELQTALQAGIDAMTKDGELLNILTEWELADAML